MLQKGLSNRPSGAVALLIVAGSLVLNLIRGENILADLFWGREARSWSNLSCYAEQAACRLRNFFEETVIGPPRDFGYEKRDRKVVEISQPLAPRTPAAKQEVSRHLNHLSRQHKRLALRLREEHHAMFRARELEPPMPCYPLQCRNPNRRCGPTPQSVPRDNAQSFRPKPAPTPRA